MGDLVELHKVQHAANPPLHTATIWPLKERWPECSFCGLPAVLDGKTTQGPWGFMCETHFEAVGVGLGLGRGQVLFPGVDSC